MSHLGTGDKTEGDRNNILHNIELIALGNMASRGDQGQVGENQKNGQTENQLKLRILIKSSVLCKSQCPLTVII